MATHSSVLAWRLSGTVEPGGLPSMGLRRVGHDRSALAAAALVSLQTSTYTCIFSIFLPSGNTLYPVMHLWFFLPATQYLDLVPWPIELLCSFWQLLVIPLHEQATIHTTRSRMKGTHSLTLWPCLSLFFSHRSPPYLLAPPLVHTQSWAWSLMSTLNV